MYTYTHSKLECFTDLKPENVRGDTTFQKNVFSYYWHDYDNRCIRYYMYHSISINTFWYILNDHNHSPSYLYINHSIIIYLYVSYYSHIIWTNQCLFHSPKMDRRLMSYFLSELHLSLAEILGIHSEVRRKSTQMKSTSMWYSQLSLVGGVNPLKDTRSSIGMTIPSIWENKKCINMFQTTNQQSDFIMENPQTVEVYRKKNEGFNPEE